MAAKSQGQNNKDWNPMRDDFNDSTFDPQYQDDDHQGPGVNLDQSRLYVTNIPRSLSEEGIRAAFGKFGTIVEFFVSHDPVRRYALISFETTGEAKLALMTLNGLDPMRLKVAVAHRKKFATHPGGGGGAGAGFGNRNNNQRRSDEKVDNYNGNVSRDYKDRNGSFRDDSSNCSRGKSVRMQDSLSTLGNEADNMLADDEILLESEDQDLSLELEQLKLEYQKIQCKQRMLQLKQAEKKVGGTANYSTNRCILPGGRVMVTNERAKDQSRNSRSPTIGAGDSLVLPRLQRHGSRACVACGSLADTYCAACKLTPYCGAVCQRRDWIDRHRSVCHNLARSNDDTANNGLDKPELAVNHASTIPQAAPLRRPRSPMKGGDDRDNNNSSNDRAKKLPPGYTPPVNNRPVVPRSGGLNQDTRRGGNFNGDNGRQNGGPRAANLKSNEGFNKNNVMSGDEKQEDDWGAKAPEPKPTAPPTKPTTTIDPPKPAKPTPPKPEVADDVVDAAAAQPADVKIGKPAAVTTKTPATVTDVTPSKKIVPKSCVIELLDVGEEVVISVESVYKEVSVCLCLHERFATEYASLCDEFGAACEEDKEPYTAGVGETFAWLREEEGAWYRARRLSPTSAALLDAACLTPLLPALPARRLPARYRALPEFSCALAAPNLKVGDNVKCTLKMKTPCGYKASLVDIKTGADIGEGTLSRWLPDVEYPAPAPASLPEVVRPALVDKSRVVLVECSELAAMFLRPADDDARRQYDAIIFDVAHYGMSAVPLTKPPAPGDVVVAQFSDGNHYRALCRRTNVRLNKYQLDYIDFGNTEVSPLEKLCWCPEELGLSRRPALVSKAAAPDQAALSEAAASYIDELKDSQLELILSLPSGSTSAPSGSVARLTARESRVDVTQRLHTMCMPQWKLLQDQGGDVLQSPSVMFSELKYLPLPTSGCSLEVLDCSSLPLGHVSACVAACPIAHHVFTNLTQRMAEYCNSELGREPYLPKFEELCIARCEPYPQWFRAVMCDTEAPGSQTLKLCFIDYGNIEEVDFKDVRKMLPEFLEKPAVASHIEIKDFPKSPTEEQLVRALTHLQMDSEGRGKLTAAKCHPQSDGFYLIEAPELLLAMQL